MAITSDSFTTTCSHCERDIPTLNMQLHYAHCSRNLQKCSICGEIVPIKHADEHFKGSHAPIDCSLCSETIEREYWSLHQDERCPKRIVTCEFCEFPLPATDLLEHQEVCGNRTELCHICNKYIRLRELNRHELYCQAHSNVIAESSVSRNETVVERDEGARRRQPNSSSEEAVHRRNASDSSGEGRRRRGASHSPNRRIVYTIAFTAQNPNHQPFPIRPCNFFHCRRSYRRPLTAAIFSTADQFVTTGEPTDGNKAPIRLPVRPWNFISALPCRNRLAFNCRDYN